jgi:hypothetical protein
MRGLVVFAVLAFASAVHAEPVNVGLFAPSAPFPSTASRVALAGKLGEQVGAALGVPASGKVFARASDFAAAVKKGEITVALVDATYLATTSGAYTVLAGSLRGSDAVHPWQLVARGGGKIDALRGKRVLVPAIGGHETELVLNVLLGGEVARDYFAKIEAAPDAAAALAAVGLGKADAAVVPAGVELPAGTQVVLTLPALAGPVLVAYALPPDQKTKLAAAATSFTGDPTVTGFRAPDPDAIRHIAARFSAPVKRGPLAVPAIRLLVGDLVEGRTFAIERTPATAFALAPGK